MHYPVHIPIAYGEALLLEVWFVDNPNTVRPVELEDMDACSVLDLQEKRLQHGWPESSLVPDRFSQHTVNEPSKP